MAELIAGISTIRRIVRCMVPAAGWLLALAVNSPAAAQQADYLYVWAAAADTARGSVLAVFDIGRGAQDRLVRLVPAGTPSGGAHHIEHALSGERTLFANAFGAGRTFLFDLSKPAEPRLAASLDDAGPFSHPHSYVRLPGGNVLATFQWKTGGALPGGLVELDKSGKALRWASAATTEADSLQIVPYSLAVLPALDRIVSTSTHMIEDIGVHVQIWRLSDLKLLRTIAVPRAAAHQDHSAHDSTHHRLPGEPRVLADGKTVMFGTFTCGLYRVTGLDTEDPQVVFTQAFPGADCAVPVVIGNYWIQTVPALRALVALDVTDPAHPVEASRILFGEPTRPHWLAADAAGRRLVTTSASPGDANLYIVDFDRVNGRLSRRTHVPVVTMRGLLWPDGYRGNAVPHGVVFGQ